MTRVGVKIGSWLSNYAYSLYKLNTGCFEKAYYGKSNANALHSFIGFRIVVCA